MSFATNANYTSAINPIDVGQPTKIVPPDLANGFKPEGGIAAEYLNWLLNDVYAKITALNNLQPVSQTFTSNGTWSKPAGAYLVRFLLVGGGACGDVGTTNDNGGKGGDAGEVLQIDVPASELPSSLSVSVGVGGSVGGSSLSGGSTFVQNGSATVLFALGGAFPGANPNFPSDLYFQSNYPFTYLGQLGGDGGIGLGGQGEYGGHSRFGGKGGPSGNVGNNGATGFGYGAGGGGARAVNGGGSAASGGGGGGGYGNTRPNGNGGGTTPTQHPGAPGICMIHTFRAP